MEEKILNDRMAADPAAQSAAKKARVDTELGRPDTTQYDRSMAELEKRKAQLEGPQDKYGQLMEYLSQISANSRPGQGSGASGAAGARALDALNKNRQLQQFELSKQSVEVAQKKLDTVRAYAEKRFNVGETEFDKVYNDQFAAAKEVTKNKADAAKLAQENTLKRLELDQREKEMRSNEKIAGMRGATSAALTPNQRAEIANKAIDNINASLKANAPLQMKAAKDPVYMQQLVANETERLMAAAEGRTIRAAPGAPSPGGPSLKYNPKTGNIE
jgi:hypothetical protein